MDSAQGVLGVLGGMGPAATADFYMKLVKATPASRDQEHIPVVIIGDPRIPDRSQAIESGTALNVLVRMLHGLRYLESAGVDAITIPCHTAHFWLANLRAETDIPFISLIEASVQEARRLHPGGSTALVLGTRATIDSHLYDAELQRAGFIAVAPTDEQQEVVDTIIARAKAGDLCVAATAFEKSVPLWSDQVDVVLLACTELPLVAPQSLLKHFKLIDTTAALVNACVTWAKFFSGNGLAR